jgi:hypothetical protein
VGPIPPPVQRLPGRKLDKSPTPSAGVKNERSYVYVSPIHHHGVNFLNANCTCSLDLTSNPKGQDIDALTNHMFHRCHLSMYRHTALRTVESSSVCTGQNTKKNLLSRVPADNRLVPSFAPEPNNPDFVHTTTTGS